MNDDKTLAQQAGIKSPRGELVAAKALGRTVKYRPHQGEKERLRRLKYGENVMIYCIFSVDNNYDQPAHNLVVWWAKKPPIEKLLAFFEMAFPGDEDVLFVVSLYRGEDVKHPREDTTYSLTLVNEGVKL